MTKKQLQKEWKRIIPEVHNKPKIKTPYPKKVVSARELLLIAQAILQKIENRQQMRFHEGIYNKVMKEYNIQKLCLKI